MRTGRDPKWAGTLALLDLSSSPIGRTRKPGAPVRRATEAVIGGSSLPTIRLIDRIDAETVLLSWSDPRAGFCGEQKWKIGAARRAGPCVVTRIHVRRRDRVYQPALRCGRRHEGAMILPDCIECAMPGQLLVPVTFEPAAETAMMSL
ncbi:MAG: DUF3331 domain-containing protein [Paraburkholderia sp.]|jgi:hypothetical protein|uniref:DUF3331 domain-containing protein n=1 Tax=unclassified Paraburkholderia TaxID=2615204 RepID=UPI00286333A3|nr:DUF3331 domain-containing protein [Paraburkholderia sp. USG1]MDR8394766.1 DUF3331 domain-containing protein [Paraburkholderia sp. USG1]